MTLPFESVILSMKYGGLKTPSLSIAAYAPAISSGETSLTPSGNETTFFKGDVTPILRAWSMALLIPTIWPRRRKAQLTEAASCLMRLCVPLSPGCVYGFGLPCGFGIEQAEP